MREKKNGSVRSRTRKVLTAVLTMSLILGCVFANELSVSMAEDSTAITTYGDSLPTMASGMANQWQMVSGEYNGNGAANKTTYSDDGYVRVQKNVVPAENENEFKVYLSADKKTVVSQDTLKTYFANATYKATTSNNYHDSDLGTVVNSMTGNEKVIVTGTETSGYNSADFTIKDSSGNTLAENITLYWSQANNVTFFLKIDDTHYILMGISVKKNSDNIVQLSSEAEELIEEQLESQTSASAALNSVTDTLGAGFTYTGVDGSSADGTVEQANGVITWTITEKSNAEETTETSTDSAGRIVKTIWNLNVAELVYTVSYQPQTSAAETDGTLTSIADPTLYDNDTKGEADVNQSAVLNYTYNSTAGTVDFPVPEVRGILHDIVFTKKDEQGNLLPGAGFTLYTSDPSTDADAHSVAETSDENGIVRFSGLSYGTYYIKETTPPSGYEASNADQVWTVEVMENYPASTTVMTMDTGDFADNVLWNQGIVINKKTIVPTGLLLGSSGKMALGVGGGIILLCAALWFIRRKVR